MHSARSSILSLRARFSENNATGQCRLDGQFPITPLRPLAGLWVSRQFASGLSITPELKPATLRVQIWIRARLRCEALLTVRIAARRTIAVVAEEGAFRGLDPAMNVNRIYIQTAFKKIERLRFLCRCYGTIKHVLLSFLPACQSDSIPTTFLKLFPCEIREVVENPSMLVFRGLPPTRAEDNQEQRNN